MKSEEETAFRYIGLAVAVLVVIVLALVFGPPKSGDGPGPTARGIPLVQLPSDLVKQLTDKDVFAIAFINSDAGITQILDFVDGSVIVRKSERTSESDHRDPVQGSEPIVALPKELAKTLLAMDVPYIAYLSRASQVLQVLELTDDGICIPCLAEKMQSPYRNTTSLEWLRGNSPLDFAIPAAEAACGSRCLCSSGRCQKVLGDCCNCRK